MTIVPCTPHIGAEIAGVDLTRPLSAANAATIRRALLDHGVVFFRDQPALTPVEQIGFGRAFGDLHSHPAAPTLDGQPEIFVIHTNKESKVANGEGWHTDVSCEAEPPSLTMLQLHVLPPTGGDTIWASTEAAYEGLSAPLRGFVDTLWAHHESEHVYRGRYKDRGVDDAGREYPSALHPVVRVHPETGRRSLYVNRSFTTRIEGLNPHESRALLELLCAHIEQPRFQVRCTWTPNAVALWDNRSTQHLAIWDYWPHERRGHRVTVVGDAPRPVESATTLAGARSW